MEKGKNMSLKSWFSHLAFSRKLSTAMISLITVLCLTVFIANLLFFSITYEKQLRQSASDWLEIATEHFNQAWDQVYQDVVGMVVNQNLPSALSEYARSGYILPVQMQVQDGLNELIDGNSIVQTACFVFPGNVRAARYSDRFDPYSPVLDFSYLESECTGPTVLPSMKSPYTDTSDVIPVIIPLGTLSPVEYVSITNSPVEYVTTTDSNPSLFLVIFLRTDAVNRTINRESSEFFTATNTLVFNGVQLYGNSTERETISRHTSLPALDVRMELFRTSLLPYQVALLSFTLILALISALVSSEAVRRISKHLTQPFSSIMKMISEIKRKTYDYRIHAVNPDEVGAMIDALNDMYRTIEDQMARIKDEEKSKYHYLARTLTEQINPHFIYNTLEAIDMEIMEKNDEDASLMIKDLSAFLRTTLNHGDDLIKLRDELRNVEAYTAIMNHRLDRPVTLDIYVDKEDENILIPKCILQPFVENSIKHGFLKSSIISPSISIHVQRDGLKLEIRISDNGCGIDVEKAEKILHSPSSEHVGVRNVYNRLLLYYGNADISFRSMPYYDSSVTIIIEDMSKTNPEPRKE